MGSRVAVEMVVVEVGLRRLEVRGRGSVEATGESESKPSEQRERKHSEKEIERTIEGSFPSAKKSGNIAPKIASPPPSKSRLKSPTGDGGLGDSEKLDRSPPGMLEGVGRCRVELELEAVRVRRGGDGSELERGDFFISVDAAIRKAS